jgi:hypothetical protein
MMDDGSFRSERMLESAEGVSTHSLNQDSIFLHRNRFTTFKKCPKRDSEKKEVGRYAIRALSVNGFGHNS